MSIINYSHRQSVKCDHPILITLKPNTDHHPGIRHHNWQSPPSPPPSQTLMEVCYGHESEEDICAKTPEITGDEEAYIHPPRRSGRGARKRVVTVPITPNGGDGYRSRAEMYPPPDSWSWRKYGQKPIKGSPYPRGYYRCSSTKGCPARKQVERSRHDPTTILITYASDHNHILSAASKNHRQISTSPSSSTATTTPGESTAANSSTLQLDIELSDDGYYSELTGELGWLCEMGSTMMDRSTLVGPVCAGGDPEEMEAIVPIGEEDQLLFGDLGDLPEYSVVFGRVDTAGHVAVA